MDPSKWANHKPELYAIWNAKAGLLDAVATDNPFSSRYFMYVDVGLFRYGPMAPWPDAGRVGVMFAKRPHAMVFGLVRPFEDLLALVATAPPAPAMRYAASAWRTPDMVMGGWFAGDAAAVHSFAASFYALLASSVADGAFVGKDQELYNFMAVRDFRENASAFIYGRECAKGPHDQWFHVTHFLAGANATRCKLAKLDTYP